MQSIRGVYTGKEIKPLEEIHARPNVKVIITFLDDETESQNAEIEDTLSLTEKFLKKCGGWSDTRTPEEIITDIYSTRSSSDRGEHFFQEK